MLGHAVIVADANFLVKEIKVTKYKKFVSGNDFNETSNIKFTYITIASQPVAQITNKLRLLKNSFHVLYFGKPRTHHYPILTSIKRNTKLCIDSLNNSNHSR